MFRYTYLGSHTPILTSTAMLLGTLINGTAIMETIFT